MKQLSVVIITLNEEKNIARCLKSVEEIADEIVIVDSNSTDKTPEICKSFGARFIQHPFEGYVKQKNFAVSQAKYDHVLSLDADEALSEKLLASIKLVKENFEADGYTMNRMTNYAGKWIKHSGWYPDIKLRLFDRRKGKWTGLIIHEKFELYKGGQIKHLNGDLLHFSFYSVDEHRRQSDKFTSLGAKADYEKGKKAPVYKIWGSPIVKFLKDYIFNLGFLDGREGFVICWISAGASYTKYQKLKKLYKENK
ncbi:MAG: glycosyltransferase family 2 protein [Bacteroidales bacterium]|jgi:glycosyltransferase involved in cell wall biosynthesis|nr:glycosyltransferase family 2 protein [Bacteroidales bacterium]